MKLICDYKIETVPHSEYPRPQFRRDSYQCLNGRWRFAVRKAGAPLGNYDKKINVPFSPETLNSYVEGVDYITPADRLYYGRDFVIEKIRKYTTLVPKEMTNKVTSSLNAERNIIFKKITDIDNTAECRITYIKSNKS